MLLTGWDANQAVVSGCSKNLQTPISTKRCLPRLKTKIKNKIRLWVNNSQLNESDFPMKIAENSVSELPDFKIFWMG